MSRNRTVGVLGLCLCSFGLVAPTLAIAECITVSGKIFNNAQADLTTLGTAHFVFGKQKFKCGIRGVPKLSDDSGDGQLNYDHTIVCDDDAGTLDPIHSQLLWDTTGDPTADHGSCGIPGLRSFSFLETSEPVLGTGTGKFAGVTSGYITVEGTLYCTLAIDMNFAGQLCFE